MNCFNGATLSRTWKRAARPRSPQAGNGFNGATLSRTWKQVLAGASAQVVHQASMEPRSAERGNVRGVHSLMTGYVVLQWSHAQPNVETTRSMDTPVNWHSFNGATLSRTWKRRECTSNPRTARRLQWSHAQPNVETQALREGPGDGLYRFNGATLSRTWKRAR